MKVPFQNIYSGSICEIDIPGDTLEVVVSNACVYESEYPGLEIFCKWLEAAEAKLSK